MISDNDEQQYHMQILEVILERHRNTIYLFISLSFLIKIKLW